MSKLLFDRTDWGSGPSPRVETTIGPFPQVALVFTSAWASARYTGSGQNAGIRVTIEDGEESVASDSFEAQTHNLTFTASTATHRVLSAGKQVRIVATCGLLGKLANTGLAPANPLKLRVTCLGIGEAVPKRGPGQLFGTEAD